MATVMIIEDNLTDLATYKKRLEEAGYMVKTEYDGKKALARILSEKPEVLLLDLGLPNVSGKDIMSSVRNDVWGMTLPIVVLTEKNVSEETINAILRFNPSFYVVKSETTAEQIVEKVQRIVDSD